MFFAFKSIAVICIISAVFHSSADSLKIAVIPLAVGSHIVSMKGVSEVLLKRGHQVSTKGIQSFASSIKSTLRPHLTNNHIHAVYALASYYVSYENSRLE